MISTDHPIKKKKQDQLKRHSLAKRISEIIQRYDDKDKESFVIGIDGPWGSGKSSFMNLVLEELEDKVILVNFNPWLFSDHASLQQSFFTVFSEAIKSFLGKKSLWVLGQLKKYGKIVADADLDLPWYIKIFLGITGLFGGSSLEKQRTKINKQLHKIDKKILIVIDDIDRLDPDETRMIFKIIKASANFQNTIFLVAYDRTRVAQLISNKDTGFDGAEYLKKIIQVNFLLPDPEPEDLWDLLFIDLNRILKDIYGSDDIDDKRWSELFHGGLHKKGLKDLFKTLRDVRSFTNSLELDWSIVGGSDVNQVDFIGIEAIRVFAPELYSYMSGNEAFFIGMGIFGIPDRDEDVNRKEKYEKMLSSVPEKIRETIDGVIKTLFPEMDNKLHRGGSWETEWRKDRRVCSPEKFRYYFKLGIPRGSISETELKELVESLNKESDFYKNLKNFEGDKKLTKILVRLLDFINPLTPQKVRNLILAVWKVQEEDKEPRSNVWDFNDLRTSVDRIVYQTILQNVQLADRVALIVDLMKESKTLHPPISFARLLVHEHIKKSDISQSLIIDGIEEIKKAGLVKVKEAIKSKKFNNSKELLDILYGWRDFGEEEKMRDYVKELTKTNQGVLELLSASVRLILSSAGNYQDIGKEDLFGLSSKEEMESKVSKITDDDLSKATDKQKFAVELFRKHSKDW